MRVGMQRQLALTRKRMEALLRYATEQGSLDSIRRYALQHGNLNTIRQLAIAPKSIGRKLGTALVIALAATALAMLMASVPPLSGVIRNVNSAVYDSFFRQRRQESKYDGDVVIVAVDDISIKQMVQAQHLRWPWPRNLWGDTLKYLEQSGAKVVVFDLLFEEPSDHERYIGDDTAFAKALDEALVPVVIACNAPEVGTAPFALPVHRLPTFGASNLDQGIIRTYAPISRDVPALAIQILKKIPGAVLPAWADKTFLLHFYGPTHRADGKMTFHQIPALEVVLAAQPDAPPMPDIKPDLFRNKIVLIGATAASAYDVKSSPVNDLYPGTEAQATAVTNLLENRRVQMFGWWIVFGSAFFTALTASAGALIPKRAWIKLSIPPIVIATAFLVGYLLFVRGWNIYWLPLAAPLLAIVLATLGGLAWTYLVEDRQRRTLRKFLAQYVSPEVAEELDRLGTISLGGVEREMSVVFTDIAGFTDLTEQLPVDQLERFMNYYLSEMSGIVFEARGTLDKYIGDAIMSFWSAPLDQPDHAIRACRTALRIKNRENEIRPILKEMGAGGIMTRIGVNTGRMKVGNYGSLQKLNYTALGDEVNLASRLEGANKLYGSQILVAQSTVDLSKDQFLFRRLDLLRVKGKKKPIAVYELMAEGAGDETQQKIAAEFEEALTAYQQQNWEKAESLLVALQQFAPQDGPTQTLLKRVRAFREDPPPIDWDGVHIAKEK
jgi:adenylate cyclase